MKILLVAVLAACFCSCTKEDVKYTKMPGNGNTNFNCPPAGK